MLNASRASLENSDCPAPHTQSHNTHTPTLCSFNLFIKSASKTAQTIFDPKQQKAGGLSFFIICHFVGQGCRV